ncbi:MAG: hypothetical protein ACKVP4_03665 [Hyphomicrobium sp.]
MDIVTLIIQLLSGAAGGNIAGAILKNISLGTLGNSLAGIIGGGLGGQILQSIFNLPGVGDALDPMAILTQVLSGGVGGGATLAIVGLLRSLIAK